MTIKNRIYTYFTEKEIHSAKEIMGVLNLQRPIVDKYLSELFRIDKKIYRINMGKYSKVNGLNDYEIERIENKKLRDNFPKLPNVFKCLKQRCNNPNHPDFPRYGGRGIKVDPNLKLKDLVEIWVRDKGWELNRPSIDRINNDGNYTRDNIRFIELSKNVGRATKGKKRVFSSPLLLTYKGHQA